MIEPPLHPGEQPPKRCGAIPFFWGTVSLKIIDANVFWSMQRPSWFCKKWRNMAARTLGLTVEHLFAATSGLLTKKFLGRCRRGNRELIKVQGSELFRYEIRLRPHISKPC